MLGSEINKVHAICNGRVSVVATSNVILRCDTYSDGMAMAEEVASVRLSV